MPRDLEKKSAYKKAYYLAHREEAINYSRSYYEMYKEKQNESSREWKRKNKEAVKVSRKEYRRLNKDKEDKNSRQWKATHKRQTRDTGLKYYYGISLECFEKMLATQKNRCGICTEKFTGKRPLVPCIDHAHTGTKEIRGLLCTSCNSGIGLFEDNIEFLRVALTWLQNNK